MKFYDRVQELKELDALMGRSSEGSKTEE